MDYCSKVVLKMLEKFIKHFASTQQELDSKKKIKSKNSVPRNKVVVFQEIKMSIITLNLLK